jgi:membrane-associated phospholipid phosphatase
MQTTSNAGRLAMSMRNLHHEIGVSTIATGVNVGLSILLLVMMARSPAPVAWGHFGLVAIGVAVLWIGAAYYRHRQELRVASTLAILASFMWSGFAGFSLAMLALEAGFPLVDRLLATLDRALLFDQERFAWAIASLPGAGATLDVIYMLSVPLIFAAALVHALRADREKLRELSIVYTGSLAATVLISGLTPAIGTFAHYGFPPELTSLLPARAGTYHLEDFARIRAGDFTLDPLAMNGVVTFPSFHMVMAMIIAFTFRSIPIVNIAAVGISALTIVATIIIGGHYVIDLVAGAGVTSAWMLLASRRPDPLKFSPSAQPATV